VEEDQEPVTAAELCGLDLWELFSDSMQDGKNPNPYEYIRGAPLDVAEVFMNVFNLWCEGLCAKYALSFNRRYE